MKQTWFILWIILLVAQLLTVWIGGRWSGQPENGRHYIEPDLVDLANLTNREWMRLSPLEEGVETSRLVESGQEELLSRQSLILQLRDSEESLRKDGIEVALVDDLQAWLAVRDFPDKDTEASAYLDNILEWLKPFMMEGLDCCLERLVLLPDGKSPFPLLAFELAGDPVDMGSSLFSVNSASAQWRLNEMDLYLPSDDRRWWMRGSYTYSARTFK